MIRERISKEEAQELQKNKQYKELLTAVQSLAKSAQATTQAETLTELSKKLTSLETAVGKIQLTANVEGPVVNVDLKPLIAEFSRLFAQLQHELVKLQSQPITATEMKMEFTRNAAGYINSPITVRTI
jgi:glycine cleavage system regulatory protein